MDRTMRTINDDKLLNILRRISEKGKNAEVKMDKNGKWVVYEVSKEKKLVG